MANFKVGVGKADVTGFVYGIGMMGYGMSFNIVKDIETNLYARAYVISNGTNKVCWVNSEICFYTIALKNAIVNKIQNLYPHWNYSDANLLLSAQHTHSGPGGYSHHILYNLTIPGFQPTVFNAIVNGTIKAIEAAENNLQDANLHFAKSNFDDAIAELAINRSINAYNKNPEVETKIGSNNAHLAIDRCMKLLYISNQNKLPIGAINWFGVHTTSLSNDNSRICSDNKGYAATYLEEKMSTLNPNFIGAFAQDTAGDVSPNFKWDAEKNWTRGKYRNDFKSAAHNGKLQFIKALELIEQAQNNNPLSNTIDYEIVYVDFSDIKIDWQFANGKKGLRTVPAAQGFSFFEGTKEGPGIGKALATAGRFASNLIWMYEKTLFKLWHLRDHKTAIDIDMKYKMHGRKHIVLEVNSGKIMGTFQIKNMILPAAADPTIKHFKLLDQIGLTKRTPWVPRILPIQIIIVGKIAVLGIAAEITTIAGKRLQETVLNILKHRGVTEVILSTYTNGYSGYITTPEEYDCQLYEGGHTIFGKYTLPAYQTKFKELALQMLKPKAERNIDAVTKPIIFAENEIWYGSEIITN